MRAESGDIKRVMRLEGKVRKKDLKDGKSSSAIKKRVSCCKNSLQSDRRSDFIENSLYLWKKTLSSGGS